MSGRAAHVTFTKVLGHAKRRHVAEGLTTWENKLGNDGADAVARAAAEHGSASLPEQILRGAQQRRDTALVVQRMFVVVVEARREREGRRPEQAEMDRGSDDEAEDCFVGSIESAHRERLLYALRFLKKPD